MMTHAVSTTTTTTLCDARLFLLETKTSCPLKLYGAWKLGKRLHTTRTASSGVLKKIPVPPTLLLEDYGCGYYVMNGRYESRESALRQEKNKGHRKSETSTKKIYNKKHFDCLEIKQRQENIQQQWINNP